MHKIIIKNEQKSRDAAAKRADTVAVKKTFPKLFTVHRSCSIGMVNDVNDE